MILRKNHNSGGFTLLEVSIVLVVIGLIVAGIMVGQSLIRSSQIQSIITDEAKYVEAARQFKEKYGYLPGDFPNATSYWGTNAVWGCSSGWGNNGIPTANTCNGNGDGIIEGPGQAGYLYMWESFTAWQQMANAGLIEGSYTGTADNGCWITDVPGLDAPATKIPGGDYVWDYSPNQNTWWDAGGKAYQQYLKIGTPHTASNCQSNTLPLFTSSEALAIDTKVDDGRPATGKWIDNNVSGWCDDGGQANGESSSNPTTYKYNMPGNKGYNNGFTATQAVCALLAEVDW